MVSSLLLLLLDSRAPAGAHGHSGGMESAVTAGLVADVADVERFCRFRLRPSGPAAAAFAAAACDLWRAGPGDTPESDAAARWAELDGEFGARVASPASRAASRQLGSGLRRLRPVDGARGRPGHALAAGPRAGAASAAGARRRRSPSPTATPGSPRWPPPSARARRRPAPRSGCSASIRYAVHGLLAGLGAEIDERPPARIARDRPDGRPGLPESGSGRYANCPREPRLRWTCSPTSTPARRCVCLRPDHRRAGRVTSTITPGLTFTTMSTRAAGEPPGAAAGQVPRIGIGGPVGTGKTALVAALCRALRGELAIGVVTNDIYTTEDADFLRRARRAARRADPRRADRRLPAHRDPRRHRREPRRRRGAGGALPRPGPGARRERRRQPDRDLQPRAGRPRRSS